MKELSKRIIVAVIGIPIALLLMYCGGIAFFIAIVIVSAGALYEFYKISEKKGISLQIYPGIALGIIYQAGSWLLWQRQLYPELFVFTFFFLLISVLAILIISFHKTEGSIFSISVSLAGILYLPVLLTSLIFIRGWHLLPLETGIDKLSSGAIVFALFVSVWVCDSAAYFGGKALGRHKLFERISPKKTWEGAAFGFLGALISFPLITHFAFGTLGLIEAAGAGAIIGIIGQVGDLAESQFKRDAGVKDSSHIFPGHGGFLDRFDSILFASPALLIYLAAIYFL
ncbi:MAG: phosphatidate cytidylyltransferase [Candidatus Kapaibacterium sp.]